MLSPRRESQPASCSGATARGQMSWWRRGSIAADGAQPKEKSLQLTSFWFESSDEAILPSKTSTPVLELATALLESSSISVGLTLLHLNQSCWFYTATGCKHCAAFHLQPTRIYFVVPADCLLGEDMPEQWDLAVLQSVCSGVRQRISSAPRLAAVFMQDSIFMPGILHQIQRLAAKSHLEQSDIYKCSSKNKD